MFMQLGFQNALYDSNTVSTVPTGPLKLLSPGLQYAESIDVSRRRLYQAMDIPGAVPQLEPFYANTIVWKNPETRRGYAQLVAFNPPVQLV